MQEDSLISLKIPGSDKDNKDYVYSRHVSRGNQCRITVIMSTLLLFQELEGGMGTFFDPPLSYVSPAHNLENFP